MSDLPPEIPKVTIRNCFVAVASTTPSVLRVPNFPARWGGSGAASSLAPPHPVDFDPRLTWLSSLFVRPAQGQPGRDYSKMGSSEPMPDTVVYEMTQVRLCRDRFSLPVT